MVTEFGKYIRKLRIENTVTLRAMADEVGKSPSYLSSVETGKRTITKDFFCSIARYFKLGQEQEKDLRHLADISQSEISMSLKEATLEQRNSAVVFARQLNSLTDDELKKIDDILEGL